MAKPLHNMAMAELYLSSMMIGKNCGTLSNQTLDKALIKRFIVVPNSW